MIVLDAARPDRFSTYGYTRQTTPNLDNLAAEGVVFRNHFAQGTDTRTTLPPLLYSRYYVPPLFPADAQVPFAAPEELFRRPDDEAVPLPEILTGAGLKTAMISAHIWLQEDSAFATTFDEAHDLSDRLRSEASSGYPDASLAVDYARNWLDTHRNEDFFLYLHLMDTHFPHAYGEDAQDFLPATEVHPSVVSAFSDNGMPQRSRRHLNPAERRYFDALYDGSLRHVDRQLGRLLDQIDSWRSEVLVAVTADHGEHLLETPGRVLHGGPWLDAVARVPWIMRYRGKLPTAVVDDLTESIDVMPTILGLLGVAVPDSVRPDGQDRRPRRQDDQTNSTFVFARGAARDATIKCLFTSPDSKLLSEQSMALQNVRGTLYDLEADPLETVDRWAERPADAARCLTAYRRRMARPFRRYQGAVRTTQPPSPFALSAAHFGITEVPSVPVGRLATDGRPSEPGWVRMIHKHRTFLAGRGKAEDRKARVALPNGNYGITLGHRGGCVVALGNLEPTVVVNRTFDPAAPRWSMRTSDLGAIKVTGEHLTLRLAPANDNAFCIVGHLGFTRLDDAGRATSPNAERRERLRALGYLD